VAGVLVVMFGIGLLVPGMLLAALGGTWYYWIAGSALIVSGLLLARGRRAGLSLYIAFLVGTALWALGEVGSDPWRLIPRVLLPFLLGVVLLLPSIVRGLLQSVFSSSRRIRFSSRLHVFPFAIGILAGIVVHASSVSTNSTAMNSEPAYRTQSMVERYSSLSQITPENADELTLAWTFRTGDLPDALDRLSGREFNFDTTPIEIGGTLYLCTPRRRIFALDALSGAERWRFDPRGSTRDNSRLSCRGVSYFQAGFADACPHRIVVTTGDGRLLELNAQTGKLCEQFGSHGYVSLTKGLGSVGPGDYVVSMPPLVVSGRIIVGGRSHSSKPGHKPSGVVRAYDASSGKLLWAWDVGRANANAPLGKGEIYTPGTPNAWSAFTADSTIGLVYVTLGNADTGNSTGVRRSFDERYSNALIALDIETGRERWRFQTVQHDPGGMDLPTAPSLVDFSTSRGTVRALVQSTRRGEIFLLDRRTGKPFAEVRRAQTSSGGQPGLRGVSTQLRSVGLPTLAPQRLNARDTWGATPLDHVWCRIQYRKHRYDGAFTRPTTEGSIVYPGYDGVIDSFGVTIDSARRILIVSSSYMPFTARLPSDKGVTNKSMRSAIVRPWLSPLGVPCSAPPWGKLTAIDLSTRSIVWQRSLGTTRDSGPLGFRENFALPTGIFNKGGSVVTRGGVIFIAATADLWKARLPAGGQATPLTYLGADGRQFVVIAAGGNSRMGTRNGDYVMAFALPHSE
jgi:quinoprotein glucose dehydrogenase